GQLEVEDLEVGADPLGCDRLGDDHVAELHVPAQQNLRGGAPVLAGDLDDRRVVEELAVPQRAPGLDGDVVRCGKITQLLLDQQRVQFHLVDHRGDPTLFHDPFQMCRLEVAHPDRTHPPFGVQAFQGLPCLHVQVTVRQGPVDEIQIELVHTHTFTACVEGSEGGVVALVRVGELGGAAHLLTPHPRPAQSLTHPHVVSVGGSGVDTAITGFQGGHDRVDRHAIGNLPHPQSQLGHAQPVVQRNLRNEDHHVSGPLCRPCDVCPACGTPVPLLSHTATCTRNQARGGAAPVPAFYPRVRSTSRLPAPHVEATRWEAAGGTRATRPGERRTDSGAHRAGGTYRGGGVCGGSRLPHIARLPAVGGTCHHRLVG